MSTKVVGPGVSEKAPDAGSKRKPLAAQSMGPLALGLSSLLILWAVVQESAQPEEARMTWTTALYVAVFSYAYADYWLWMLHCFLDRKENLKSQFGIIKELATSFQQHHDCAATLLQGNHLGEVDAIVSATAGTGLLLGAFTSPSTKLISVGICVWGSLAGLNHFYGHARTHLYQVPALFKYGQDWGLLPTALHHKIHHTAPFEMNWNFLNGGYKLYEEAYFATGSSYDCLMYMFYTCNPMCFQIWACAVGLLV
jgi:hypothetical protein